MHEDRAQEKYLSAAMHCKKVTELLYRPKRKYQGGVLGIGETSFLEFPIEVPELKYKVSRRYSDFQWLRTILLKFYPTEIIPPIPNKKAAKRSSRQIEKRRKILEMFLNDLLKIEPLANSKYVYVFLSCQDKDKFFYQK